MRNYSNKNKGQKQNARKQTINTQTVIKTIEADSLRGDETLSLALSRREKLKSQLHQKLIKDLKNY